MGEITDVFNGKLVSCWKDEEFIFLSFPWATINFPKEEWGKIKKELKRLAKTK